MEAIQACGWVVYQVYQLGLTAEAMQTCNWVVVTAVNWEHIEVQQFYLSLIPRPTPFFLFFGFRWQ